VSGLNVQRPSGHCKQEVQRWSHQRHRVQRTKSGRRTHTNTRRHNSCSTAGTNTDRQCQHADSTGNENCFQFPIISTPLHHRKVHDVLIYTTAIQPCPASYIAVDRCLHVLDRFWHLHLYWHLLQSRVAEQCVKNSAQIETCSVWACGVLRTLLLLLLLLKMYLFKWHCHAERCRGTLHSQ